MWMSCHIQRFEKMLTGSGVTVHFNTVSPLKVFCCTVREGMIIMIATMLTWCQQGLVEPPVDINKKFTK